MHKITKQISCYFVSNYRCVSGKSMFEHTVYELPITPAGRINGVKMNILSEFLFVFKTLLIIIQKSLFASNDSIVANFM